MKDKNQEEKDKTVLDGEQAKRVLDRLLLLEEFISREDVLGVLKQSGCVDKRRCTLTFEVMTWMLLAMGVLTELPIRAVFKASRSLTKVLLEKTPHRSSFCVGRQRLGIAPVRRLFEAIARPLATPALKGAFYRSMRLMGIDGTVLNVPDSEANAKAFGRPKAGDRGDSAFPQVRKVSLVELGTHAEVAFYVKGATGKGSGEQSVAPFLVRRLERDMLLLWDRGFYGYELWHEVLARGANVLGRVKSRVNLPVRKRLPDGSYLSAVYRNDGRKKRTGETEVRVIKYTHNDPKRVGCGEDHFLMTSLLDDKKYPAHELILLYHERWEIELVFDEQKTHQAPVCSGKEANLRSETPMGVVQEIYALSIGHYVTRALMAETAAAEGIDPDRLSFVGTLRVLREALPDYAKAVDDKERALVYRALLKSIAEERVDPRRDRINPRVVKKKMSRYLKKRSCHRGPHTKTKPFTQYVVMY